MTRRVLATGVSPLVRELAEAQAAQGLSGRERARLADCARVLAAVIGPRRQPQEGAAVNEITEAHEREMRSCGGRQMTEPLLCPISWARKIGEAKGLRTVIVFQELPDGRWGFTSWGRKMADCRRAAAIGEDIMGDVYRAAEKKETTK